MNARSRLIAGLAVLGIALIVVSWYLLRPNYLVRVADSTVNGLLSGDEVALLNAISSQEIACSDLDAGKLRQAWEILMKPRIEGSVLVRTERAVALSNGTQATAGAWLKDSSGNPWQLAVVSNKTDEGAKVAVLFHMLVMGTSVDEHGNALSGSTANSLLAGIRKYRSKLETLGIHRLMLNPGRCVTWDDLEARLVKSIELESERKLSGQEPNPKTK